MTKIGKKQTKITTTENNRKQKQKLAKTLVKLIINDICEFFNKKMYSLITLL